MAQTALLPRPAVLDAQASAAACAPRVDLISGRPSVIDSIAGDWGKLCAESSNDEPFYRPEWIRAYARAFDPGSTLHILTCREGDRLTAVLPLLRERTLVAGLPVRRLRSAANVHSCHFDLLRAAGAAGDRAIGAVWNALGRFPDWDILDFGYVPAAGAICSLVSTAASYGYRVGRWEMMRSPYIRLGGSEQDDPCAGHTTRHFRLDLGRKGRRLAEHGEVRTRRITCADMQDLDQFFRLESSGWKGRAGTAIACDSATAGFYTAIAKSAAADGYLTIFFLDLNGRAIAGQLGLTYGPRYYTPKLAYDETYSQFGPGHLLIAEVLKVCARDGVAEFDITGPWAEYKAKWTRDTRPIHRFWIFRNSPYGRILHRLFAVAAFVKGVRQRAEASIEAGRPDRPSTT
jgi:CelD/BcsL family acetyltransferase involved in cellulose biosynthesis